MLAREFLVIGNSLATSLRAYINKMIKKKCLQRKQNKKGFVNDNDADKRNVVVELSELQKCVCMFQTETESFP